MTTSDRITVLETQLRTMKRMVFGLCAVIAAGFLVAATSMQSVPDVIQAKRFEVVKPIGVGGVVAALYSDSRGQ